MGLFSDAVKALKGAGFSDRTLPSILANIDVETGGTFDWQQKQNKGGNGYGLFQFDSQKDKYFDWLSKTSKKDSALSQSQFVYGLIYDKEPFHDIGYGHRKELRKSFKDDGVDWMTSEFMDRYERPDEDHWERRLEAGQKYKGMLTKSK